MTARQFERIRLRETYRQTLEIYRSSKTEWAKGFHYNFLNQLWRQYRDV